MSDAEGSDAVLKGLAELEKMANEVEQASGSGELSSGDVNLQPIITPIVEEPVQNKPEEANVVPSAPVVESQPETPPASSPVSAGMSLTPQVVDILRSTSGALDLILFGIQTKIARAGLNEDTEQLGALSMILANIKNAKSKVDSVLG